MKYYQTINKIIIDENRNVIPMDESKKEFQDYVKYLKSNGEVIQTEMLSDYEIELDRQQKIDALKKECYNELALTDWYFVRKMDIGVEIPIEVIEQRNAIRKKYNDLINKII